MEFGFGTGVLTGLRTDNSLTNTPIRFGTLQNATAEFAADSKGIWGMQQYAVDTSRGKTKISVKAKVAQIRAQMYNELFFTESLSSGQKKFAFNESVTLGSAATSYTVTNAASTPLIDQGVFFATDQTQLTAVSSGPGSGQYTFVGSTGVYTFSTHTSGLGILVNYLYTTTTGYTITGSNPLMGSAPRFVATLMQQSPHSTKQIVLRLFACTSTRLSFPTILDDYTVQDLDFEAFADDSGHVFEWSTAE